MPVKLQQANSSLSSAGAISGVFSALLESTYAMTNIAGRNNAFLLEIVLVCVAHFKLHLCMINTQYSHARRLLAP